VRTAWVDSVNIGDLAPNPYKSAESTGIAKRPVDGPVEVRDPGPKTTGLGSGVVADSIGDVESHGGSDQALYAFAREDLDDWQLRLGRELPNGFFGENLTTRGFDVNAARLGERWRIGEVVVLHVTGPRIPCATFRGWVGEKGWLKTCTQAARPGSYLRVVTAGVIAAGDPSEVVHRPEHDVTVSMVYRAVLSEPDLLPGLLAAGDDLDDELREIVASKQVFELD
jgi:MOSC domain-containing protein YiiM